MSTLRTTTTNPAQRIVRSVDLGNGFTKITLSGIGADLDISSMSFPSFVTPAWGGASLSNASGLTTLNVLTVTVDGIAYRVGPDSISTASGRASRIPLESFYSSLDYKALFLGALAYMNLPDSANRIDVLGFGLPLSVFNDEALKMDIVRFLKGKHVVPSVSSLETRTIEIGMVALMPQLIGSLSSISVESGRVSEVWRACNLVIDVGYGALKWLTTDGFKPQIERSGSNRGGVSSIIQAIAGGMNPDYAGNPHILGRIDDALRLKTTVKINGAEMSLAPFLTSAQEQVIRNLREIVDTVGAWASIDNIFLVGGGAHLYESAIQRLCSNRTITRPTSSTQLSDLLGFQIQAEKLQQK